MKNQLTLSAILVTLFTFSASASDYYQKLVTSASYSKAKVLLENIEKTDQDSFDNLIRLIAGNDSLRIFAIHRLINLRCKRYLNKDESETCGIATMKMLQILDFDIRFLSPLPSKQTAIAAFIFVAFQKSLIEKLNKEETGKYLALIAQKFEEQAYSSLTQFNLWELTLNFYSGNEEKALSTLAILFQDTSTAQIHLEYLARRDVEGSRFFEPNVSHLARVIELMIRSQEEQPEIFNELAYPAGLSSQFNNNIYHFYVPWYLSLRLKRIGISERFASIAPFMLTSTYEFITSKKDLSYLFLDPKQLSQPWILKDIYAGFVAARLGQGVGRGHRTFTQVQDFFSKSTALAMESMLSEF